VNRGSADEPGVELEVVWSRKALARLNEIRQYVAVDKPEAATRLAARIMSVVTALRGHPNLGRLGAEPGTRELVSGGTPYIVIYRRGRKRVIVLTVLHGAQKRLYR
jgi:toxin ParE1/3/4